MKLFGCCKQVQSGVGYQVTSRNTNKKPKVNFYKSYNEISKDELKSLNASIVKINKSDYETIAKDHGKKDKKWTDFSFPPNDQSLGVFQKISSNKWKRISQIVQNPVIFKASLNSNNWIRKQYLDTAFSASITALAEKPDRIQDIFGDQEYNSNGFYRVYLRVNSQIQEVLIDDFVPVDQDGTPLFVRPHDNQIWVVLLQKARAKVHGSYQNLFGCQSTPKEVLQQINFAPSEKVGISKTINENQSFKVWRSILDNTIKGRPIVVKSRSKEDFDWNELNLVPNHYYSLIDNASLRNSLGNEEKVLKLRTLYGISEWKGTAHHGNNLFWDSIEQSDEKARFLSNELGREGTLNIQLPDFLKYFSEVHLNYFEQNGSYITEELFFNLKNGLLHQIQVFNEGFYTFSIDQALQSSQGWTRTSLLIIKKFSLNGQFQYEFTDGTLNVSQSTALLKTHLNPGTYLLYSKSRPTLEKQEFPKSSRLIVYSQHNIKLCLSSQQKHPDILKKTFLSYGRNHKRQLFNDDLMWMSWKLFNQGGYGFVAFGNDKDSKQRFVVTFNEDDFASQGLTLKKPYKGNGPSHVIEVQPGEEAIILVTVGNSINKNRKFPPKVGVNIHPFVKESSQSSANQSRSN